MSLSTGLVAIKGQHFDKFPEIFNLFKLIDTNKDEQLDNWNKASEVIYDEHMNPKDNSQRRIVWFDNGWTIIEDLSLILCTDEESLIKLSYHLSTPVLSLLTQGTSSCYAFWYFDKQKLRSFFNSDGKVIDNFGTPLAEEKSFNINENSFYDDIHGVAKQFGVDWANAESLNSFTVKHLENSDELNNEIDHLLSNCNPEQLDSREALNGKVEQFNSIITDQIAKNDELIAEKEQDTKNHHGAGSDTKSKPWWKFW